MGLSDLSMVFNHGRSFEDLSVIFGIFQATFYDLLAFYSIELVVIHNTPQIPNPSQSTAHHSVCSCLQLSHATVFTDLLAGRAMGNSVLRVLNFCNMGILCCSE